LEWYSWSTFSEIEEIGKGGYGTVFRAKTKLQKIRHWDHQKNEWHRYEESYEAGYEERDDSFNEYVALKTIGYTVSLSKDLLNEVIRIY